jgi:hypothetical protein
LRELRDQFARAQYDRLSRIVSAQVISLGNSEAENMKRRGIFLCLFLTAAAAGASKGRNEKDTSEFLHEINATFSFYGNQEIVARWNYITDITTDHEEAMVRPAMPI